MSEEPTSVSKPKGEGVFLDRTGGNRSQRSSMFQSVAVGEVLCYSNNRIQEVCVGNSKKKKMEKLEVPDH